MRVVIVNTLDNRGGAARSAYRLHDALLAKGVDSIFLVQNKESKANNIKGPESKIEKLIAKFIAYLDSLPFALLKTKEKTHFSSSWVRNTRIIQKINSLSPDIVHLHWVCGGMISIEDLCRIKSPIVWSLHDMWAFTDGYHIDTRFDPKSIHTVRKEQISSTLQKWIYWRKRRCYKRLNNITIVGLSRWMNECSKKSRLLGTKSHFHIPNPINTKIYSPFDKEKSRELLDLPKDKKIVLFGAVSATDDPNKGFINLVKAIDLLSHSSEVELVVFGAHQASNSENLKLNTRYVGVIHDDISLRLLYNAADVMVVPSFIENLSNAIMESLSCGTPVVAFDTGGNRDLIKHKLNGYLASAFNADDLAKGINWVLFESEYNDLSKNARNHVLENFDSDLVSERYIKLYNSILSK